MLQVLRYVVLIWLREYKAAKDQKRLDDFLLPPILPIIVYHGERDFNAPVLLGKLIRPIEGFLPLPTEISRVRVRLPCGKTDSRKALCRIFQPAQVYETPTRLRGHFA